MFVGLRNLQNVTPMQVVHFAEFHRDPDLCTYTLPAMRQSVQACKDLCVPTGPPSEVSRSPRSPLRLWQGSHTQWLYGGLLASLHTGT